MTQTFERHSNATLLLQLAGGQRIETTPEHPFYVEGRGFVRAAELGIGTSIVTRAGPNLQVLAAQLEDAPATVYNLEVADFHTYFVGKNALWVHNDCSRPEIPPYTADEIANGHAFDHVEEGQFRELGVADQEQFANLIDDVIARGEVHEAADGHRIGFYDSVRKVLVIVDPNRADKGTCYTKNLQGWLKWVNEN